MEVSIEVDMSPKFSYDDLIEVITKTDASKAHPTCMESLQRALFGAKVSDTSSSSRSKSQKKQDTEIEPDDPRPSAKRARLAAEKAAALKAAEVKGEVKMSKSKEDLNIMVDSFGPLTKRRQKALSSKYSSGDVGTDDESASKNWLLTYHCHSIYLSNFIRMIGDKSFSIIKRRQNTAGVSPSASKEFSRRKSLTITTSSISDADDNNYAAEETSLHRKIEYVGEETVVINGYDGGALSYEDAVLASAKAKANRREQSERAKMRALAESASGGGKGKKDKKI